MTLRQVAGSANLIRAGRNLQTSNQTIETPPKFRNNKDPARSRPLK